MKRLLLLLLALLIVIEASEKTLDRSSLAPLELTVNEPTVEVPLRPLSNMIHDLQLLHPSFRAKVEQLIDSCCGAGITLEVRETFRTGYRQDYLARRKKRVTALKGGNSYHQYGLAVDVAIVVNGKYRWYDRKLWRRVGLIGESLGLQWGGRWRRLYDPGHFEWAGGCTIAQLKEGCLPASELELVSLRGRWKKILEQSCTM